MENNTTVFGYSSSEIERKRESAAKLYNASLRLIGVWNYTERHIFPLPNDWRDLEIYIDQGYYTPSCIERLATASFGDMNEQEIRTLIRRDLCPREKDEKIGGSYWGALSRAVFDMCFYYLHAACPPSERTFLNVLKLMHCAWIPERLRSEHLTLSVLIETLEQKEPRNEAVRAYSAFRLLEGDTFKDLHYIERASVLAECEIELLEYFKRQEESAGEN